MLISDARLDARYSYTLALREARRKHDQMMDELFIFDVAYREETFQSWLKGWEFDVREDPEDPNGSIIFMRAP